MDAFKKLTELQKSIGYKEGELSLIALMGLMGESAEVVEHWISKIHPADVNKYWVLRHLQHNIFVSKETDALKKSIRDNKIQLPSLNFIGDKTDDKVDIEIADAVYYLNALAVNRGKTLQDYASISYEKVSRRIAHNHNNGITNLETAPAISACSCCGNKPQLLSGPYCEDCTREVSGFKNESL